MTRREFEEGMIPLAKKGVPFGVYAVEKNGHIDMVKNPCKSRTQLKRLKREYKAAGFKVYANESL